MSAKQSAASNNSKKIGIKTIALVFLMSLVVQTNAQTLVRQESSNQIKKVVYSGDASKFPQIYNAGAYYAIIPVPEINLTNMPSVTVWVYPTDYGLDGQSDLGLESADYAFLYSGGVILSNGICYLGWSSPGEAQYDPSDIIKYANYTNFMITVVYEDILTNSQVQQLLPIGQIQATLTNSVITGASINVKFTTQTNNFYYIQASTNLTMWTNYDGPFLGDGSLFLKTYPTTNQSKMFFRFDATPLELR